MSVKKVVSIAGEIGIVKVSGNLPPQAPGEKRGIKKNPTTAAVQRHNEKLAVQELTLKIGQNFRKGDYFLLLTYDDGTIPTKKEARKRLEKFQRQLKALYNRYKVQLRRISVTEYENVRLHHHVLVNAAVPFSEIDALWPYGFLGLRSLRQMGGYRALAEYIIKETRKTFRESGAVSRNRYNCSKGMEQAQTTRSQVSSCHLFDDPVAPDGYYIIKDSIRRGENPFTGRRYLEYMIVSLTEEPRLTIWPKGKKSRTRSLEAQAVRKWLRDHEEIQETFLADA